MATNDAKFEYDLLQAESLDDYFTHLDEGKNLLPIGGIQFDDLPAVKIGTPEAKDVREILGDLPFMLRNIKNSYLTVDLMPSGIAYDNTSLNNVLLIKLDIVNWFELLYNTAKREDLVTSMANLAQARDKTEELNEKLTNYENKTTNDALRDADEQLDNADNSTESSEALDDADNSTERTSEAMEKLEHDNLVDHLGKASPQEDEQAKDGEAVGSDQASASNKDAPSDDHKPTADNNAENQANHENDENSQDDTANNDIKNPDDPNESDGLSTNSNDLSTLDYDLPELDNVTEHDEENQENSQNTESTNNANGTDALLNGVENSTENDDENQENSQNTESTNNVNGTDALLNGVENSTENDDENQENSQNTESTNNVNGTDALLNGVENSTENDDENQENSQNTEATNNVNGTDALLNGVENSTENDDENQENSQNTEATNNVNGTDNNTDDNNTSLELDNLEKEKLSHNVTHCQLSAEAQTGMVKPDDKFQSVKTVAENAKANINPEIQAKVPSVKMQTPSVQVTNSTGQDTQTQLLTKMMETLNLVLKRETKKAEEKQEPKAVSELTPKERLTKFRRDQDQLIASMIAKHI